ncbi:Mitotic spindle checkpoint protein MAD2 [Arabidopsis thaliana]
MASKTAAAKDIITLHGSAAIVSEFFCAYFSYSTSSKFSFHFPRFDDFLLLLLLTGYAANSILYNRAVYPEESFVKVKKYGLPMLLIEDESVKSFMSNLTSQISEWLEAGKLQRVVLVIMSKATGEVLERWNFRIETDNQVVEKGVSREKSDKEIMREIQAIMRQVASSVTYLPCLDETCKNQFIGTLSDHFETSVFDVLAYTDTDVAVPFTWIESDPKLIANPQMVKLHGFDTKIHKVDTLVSYKNDEWDEEE